MNLQKKIDILGPWWQKVNFPNGITTHKTGVRKSGVISWRSIKALLPSDLTGKRILDIGCNAGYYGIESAMLGAEVIGIEKRERWTNQFDFLKEWYEKHYDRKLNVEIQNFNFKDRNNYNLGKFDYIFSFYVFDKVGKNMGGEVGLEMRTEFLLFLKGITNFIVYSIGISKRFHSIFEDCGFELVKSKGNFNLFKVKGEE